MAEPADGEAPSLQLRTQLIEVAHAMLDRRMGVLEGARKIDDLRMRHPYPDLMMFVPFRGVSSESDGYPLGDVRQHWHPDALAKLDKKMEAYVSAVRDDIMSACRDVLRAYDRLVPREKRPAFLGAVQSALMEEWDPIGIRGIPGADDEYWSYAPQIAEMLDMRATRRDVLDHLWWLETDQMGFPGDRVATERFAESLVRLRNSFVAPEGPSGEE
ncbi:MAG: hypothetical protein JO055_18250 [Alphaproteobacteria bacterium]|nr:hypothetical protein [Alphaproteobacteria bacterium]